MAAKKRHPAPPTGRGGKGVDDLTRVGANPDKADRNCKLGVVLRRGDGWFLRKIVVVRREGPTISYWTEDIGEASVIDRDRARGLAGVLLPGGGWSLVVVATA